MKVALGPMEMMTDSLRLSEGVPEQMKKGELTLVMLVIFGKCLFLFLMFINYVHTLNFLFVLEKKQINLLKKYKESKLIGKIFISKCFLNFYYSY